MSFQLIEKNIGGRNVVIGSINEEKKIFEKRVVVSKHLFQETDSWGIDGETFTNILEKDNYTIEIYDSEEEVRYITKASIYKRFGDWQHHKNEQADHGSQIFLARRYFDKVRYKR